MIIFFPGERGPMGAHGHGATWGAQGHGPQGPMLMGLKDPVLKDPGLKDPGPHGGPQGGPMGYHLYSHLHPSGMIRNSLNAVESLKFFTGFLRSRVSIS